MSSAEVQFLSQVSVGDLIFEVIFPKTFDLVSYVSCVNLPPLKSKKRSHKYNFTPFYPFSGTSAWGINSKVVKEHKSD